MRILVVALICMVLYSTAAPAETPPAKGPGPAPSAGALQPRSSGNLPGPSSQRKPSGPPANVPRPATGSEHQADIRAQQDILDRMKKNPVPGPNPGGCTSGQSCPQRETVSFDGAGIDTGDYRFEKAGFAGIAQAVEAAGAPTIVVPEVPAAVRLSRSDVNRITCPAGEIRDVVFSKEKGISVSFSGKDAYLKYRYIKDGGKRLYPPVTEIFIVCGEATYNLIAVPEKIPAQTVRLSSGGLERIRKNRIFFSGMSAEKKLLAMIKAVYTDEIPEGFTVEAMSRPLPRIFRDVDISLNRIVTADGEGLRLKEYILSVPGDSRRENIEFDERDFLKTDLTTGTIAISMDRLMIKRGESARLFICEANKGGQEASSAKEVILRIDKGREGSAAGERGKEEGKPKNTAPQGTASGRDPAGHIAGDGGRR